MTNLRTRKASISTSKQSRIQTIMQHLFPKTKESSQDSVQHPVRKPLSMDEKQMMNRIVKLNTLLEIYRMTWISIMLLSIFIIIIRLRKLNINIFKFWKIITFVMNLKKTFFVQRRNYLYLIEPMIATAMLSAFSVVCTFLILDNY